MSKNTYRYCGASTEVGGVFEGPTALKKYGQSFEATDDLARDIILGGGNILPEAAFDEVGFTEQELSLYSDSNSHAMANDAFHAKKKRAGVACHELRTRLEAGGTLSGTAPTPPAEAPETLPE